MSRHRHATKLGQTSRFSLAASPTQRIGVAAMEWMSSDRRLAATLASLPRSAATMTLRGTFIVVMASRKSFSGAALEVQRREVREVDRDSAHAS